MAELLRFTVGASLKKWPPIFFKMKYAFDDLEVAALPLISAPKSQANGKNSTPHQCLDIIFPPLHRMFSDVFSSCVLSLICFFAVQLLNMSHVQLARLTWLFSLYFLRINIFSALMRYTYVRVTPVFLWPYIDVNNGVKIIILTPKYVVNI